MDKLDMYIRQARQHGQTEDEIHEDLVEAGWEPAHIKRGLAKPVASSHENGQAHDQHQDQEPAAPHWHGAFRTYGQAIKAINRDAKPALFYVVALTVIDMAANLLVNKSLKVQPGHFVELAVIQGVVFIFFLPFIVRYPLALAKGKKLSIEQLLRPDPKQHINLIVTLLMVVALYIVGTLTLGVLLIWFLPWCLLMMLPVVDLDCSPAAALGEAQRLAAKNKGKAWAIFGVSLIPSLVIIVLSHVPVIGSILSSAGSLVYYVAAAFLYVWLRENVAA